MLPRVTVELARVFVTARSACVVGQVSVTVAESELLDVTGSVTADDTVAVFVTDVL